MSGAMSGSAILAAHARQSTLSIVALTINNTCNLACPHCYLQYDGPRGLVSDEVLACVLESNCEGICIVGMEPLANRAAARRVDEIVERAGSRGKWVSIITNGLNAALLPADTAKRLAWIDVSLDGGPRTYEQYRNGSWTKLLRALAELRERTPIELRLLQTLSWETASAIDDMLDASALLQARFTVFSPFQITRGTRVQTATEIDPVSYVNALAPYRHNPDIFVTMDATYGGHHTDTPEAVARGRELFGGRFLYVDTDPIDRGLMRVTYDGIATTPFGAINTRDYATVGMPVQRERLDAIFDALQFDAPPTQLN